MTEYMKLISLHDFYVYLYIYFPVIIVIFCLFMESALNMFEKSAIVIKTLLFGIAWSKQIILVQQKVTDQKYTNLSSILYRKECYVCTENILSTLCHI